MFIKLTQEEKQAIIEEIKRFYVEEREKRLETSRRFKCLNS